MLIMKTVLPALLRTVPSRARLSVCMETTAVHRNTANEEIIIKIESQSYIPKSCHVLVRYTKITQPKVHSRSSGDHSYFRISLLSDF